METSQVKVKIHNNGPYFIFDTSQVKVKIHDNGFYFIFYTFLWFESSFCEELACTEAQLTITAEAVGGGDDEPGVDDAACAVAQLIPRPAAGSHIIIIFLPTRDLRRYSTRF